MFFSSQNILPHLIHFIPEKYHQHSQCGVIGLHPSTKSERAPGWYKQQPSLDITPDVSSGADAPTILHLSTAQCGFMGHNLLLIAEYL